MRKTSILFVLLLLACVPTPKVPGNADSCARAQVKLTELKCREAKSPRGTPFEAICNDKLKDEIDLGSNCIATITDCKEVDKCTSR